MKLLNTIKTSFAVATALFMLIAVSSPVIAQDNNQESDFDTWDTDNDTMLSEDEFNSGLSDMGYYDDWDADDNGELSEDEWDTGVDEYLDDYETGEFSTWDIDGDDALSEDEFDSGLFDTVDEDDDDFISEDEYDSWYDDGLF